MRLPVVKNLVIYKEVAMFTKTFASLLNHDVFITDTMEILSNITTNEVYSDIIKESLDNLAKGARISDAFKGKGAFPIVAYEMLVTGENTGTTNTVNNTGYSDTPQSNIDDINSSEYLTEYTHNVADNTITNNTTTTTSNSGKSNKTINEVVTRTADNELDLLIKFQTEYNNIWTMLYADLDCLFYGLV